MPIVPQYEDRGIRLDPGYDTRHTEHATGDMFGAGVGEALSNVGNGVMNVADAMAKVQKMKSDADAAARVQDATRQANLAFYGDGQSQIGYGATSGRKSIDDFGAYQQKLDEIERDSAKDMDPATARVFSEKFAPIKTSFIESGLKTRAAGQKSYILEEHKSSQDNYQQLAVANAADENKFGGFLANGIDDIKEQAVKEGWGPERLTEETNAYISGARKTAALNLSEADPIAALSYVSAHSGEMTPADRMAALDALKPGAAAAIKRDAGHATASNPAPNQFAALGMPRDAYALLGTISGTEARSYDILNGGERFFNFGQHPDRVGQGGTTTAAGRYQIIKGTWGRVAAANGLTDFSPSSQDRGAWWLAQADYQIHTGRNLSDDIDAGRWGDVRNGLKDTWAGLGTLSDEEFGRRMTTALGGTLTTGSGQAGGIGSDTTAAARGHNAGDPSIPVGSPPEGQGARLSDRAEAVLAVLPQAYADSLRSYADAGVKEFETAEAASQKKMRDAQADNYKLRIANLDGTLTANEINRDPVLDNGQKAALINSWNDKNKQQAGSELILSSMRDPSKPAVFDAFDGDTQKAADMAAVTLTKQGATSRQAAEAVLGRTGITPKPYLDDIRVGLLSRRGPDVLDALQRAQRLDGISGTAFSRDGGDPIHKAATDFKHMVNDLGFTPEEAAFHYMRINDPENRKIVSTDDMNKALKGITAATVVKQFDKAWLSDPALGFTPAQTGAMLADYKELYRTEFEESGDKDIATGRANEMFARLYNASDVTGKTTVMKYPPEKYYPAIGGSYQYLRDQLVAAVTSATGEDVEPGKIALVPSPRNASRVNAGGVPSYTISIERKDENGQPYWDVVKPGLEFTFDPQAALRAAQAGEAEQTRKNEDEYHFDRQSELERMGLVKPQYGTDADKTKINPEDIPATVTVDRGETAVERSEEERQRMADKANQQKADEQATIKGMLERANQPLDILNAMRTEQAQAPAALTAPVKPDRTSGGN